MIILNYLLEKECDNAFNGDSYEYYKAVNFLSLDCTMQLRKRKIYIDEEDLFTKDVINKIAS